MNFITFPVATTNAFPMANTVSGGQLVTEFNLTSRESVSTDSSITYRIGHSYVHSESDFEVKILSDDLGTIINSYTLSISEGRGVVNGYFVETLAPMTIDLVEANVKLNSQSRPILKGNLAVGIRTFFATEQTVAGSILVENQDDMYLGIQLVVLPVEEMITPIESPYDKSKVTADIKLATFTFINNTITNLVNSKTKLQFLNANRIAQLEAATSSMYVTKNGLNSKKIYAFAGKGTDPSTGLDTWTDVTDSLIIWDSDPQRTYQQPSYTQAQIVDDSENAYLMLPHKQVAGMTDENDNLQYYAPRALGLPSADYLTNKLGFVTKSYTQQIKNIASKVEDLRASVNGKQLLFLDTKYYGDELPEISPSWDIGDYVIVKYDYSYFGENVSDSEEAPATMYFILPGYVESIKFVAQVDGDAVNEATIPSNIKGMELRHENWYESSGKIEPEDRKSVV